MLARSDAPCGVRRIYHCGDIEEDAVVLELVGVEQFPRSVSLHDLLHLFAQSEKILDEDRYEPPRRPRRQGSGRTKGPREVPYSRQQHNKRQSGLNIWLNGCWNN
jgi:hypothetical protein